MTHVSRQLLMGFVLALSGFAAGSACADSHQPAGAPPGGAVPPHKMQSHGMDNPDGPDRHGGGMASLNLNETQRDLYKAAMGQKMQSMQTGMSLHEDLRELSQADTFDEKKVRETIAKHQKEAEEKMVSSSKAMNEFYKSLSPEQKAQLKDMHKKRKEQLKARLKEEKNNPDPAKKPADDKPKAKTEPK